jgi:Raf kinase inhibitor-like YbhB/YbcL family protein
MTDATGGWHHVHVRTRLALLTATLFLAGCSGAPAVGPTPTPGATLTVTSSAFHTGAAIPERYTCKGAGDAPPLAWSGDLHGAPVVAVIVVDPDAPNQEYVHWVVFDLAAGTKALGGAGVPAGTKQALNSSGSKGWTAPCPPSGTHHYHFAVYALSSPTGLPDGVPADQARQAIASRAVAFGELVGTVGS